MQEKICSHENGDLWQTLEMEILSRHAFGQRVKFKNAQQKKQWPVFRVSRSVGVTLSGRFVSSSNVVVSFIRLANVF